MAATEALPVADREVERPYFHIVDDEEALEAAEPIDFGEPVIVYQGKAVEKNRADLIARMNSTGMLDLGALEPKAPQDPEAYAQSQRVTAELGFYGLDQVLLDGRTHTSHFEVRSV